MPNKEPSEIDVLDLSRVPCEMVREVLLPDGWHQCRAISFEDGLLSSTFRAGNIGYGTETRGEQAFTAPGYSFADENDVVLFGPLSAIKSVKVMPESVYLRHLQQSEAR